MEANPGDPNGQLPRRDNVYRTWGIFCAFLIGFVSFQSYTGFVRESIDDPLIRFYHIFTKSTLFILFVTSYARAYTIKPRHVPWVFSTDRTNNLPQLRDGMGLTHAWVDYICATEHETGLLFKCRNGIPVLCNKCNVYQPERTFHCDDCQRCVIGGQEHAHFFDQCIHEGNLKYVTLTAFYALLISVLILKETMRATDTDYKPKVKPSLRLALLDMTSMVTIVITSAYFLKAFYNFITHSTPLEREQPGFVVRYSFRNIRTSMRSVMGNHGWMWFIPMNEPEMRALYAGVPQD